MSLSAETSVKTSARKGIVCLLLLALSACATQEISQGGLPVEKPQTNALQGARIHTELAGEYYARGQMGVAIEEVNEALRSDPNYAPAYNVLGLVYMDLREYKLAEENFERAIKLAPNDSDSHHNYGVFLCQHRRGQEAEAVRHFLAAIKNPLYATPDKSYVQAGMCSQQRGIDKDAIEFFQKALLIQPAQTQALLGLAQVHYKSGDLVAAKYALARHAQTATPTAESLWLGLRIERKSGDANAEASYAYQLQKRFPNSKEAIALQEKKYD